MAVVTQQHSPTYPGQQIGIRLLVKRGYGKEYFFSSQRMRVELEFELNNGGSQYGEQCRPRWTGVHGEAYGLGGTETLILEQSSTEQPPCLSLPLDGTRYEL